MKRLRVMACALVVLVGLTGAAQAAIDHAPWDGLLRRRVDEQGRVDYVGRYFSLVTDQTVLDGYLARLATVQPDQLASKEERLAFWINAYNACVFKGVLGHYPVKSVREIKGFFDNIRYRVAGQDLTLNEIEARGRALGDWRIHVGVVCASASCPMLRNEAYAADRLDAQLTEQVKRFLQNPRTGLRLEGSTLWVSSVFKWYATDFVPGRMTAASLLAVLEPYLDPRMAQAIQDGQPALKFLGYDWSLNAQRTP